MNGANVKQLAAAIDRQVRTDGLHATAVPELTLIRFSAPSEPVPVVYEPSLCLIAQGSKRVELAGEAFQYDPAHFLLVSVDLPVCGRVTEATPAAPYLGVKLTLDAGMVGELVADGAGTDARGSARGLAVSPVEPALLDAVGRLVGLGDNLRDAGALAPLVLREITYRLLTGEQGMRLRQIAAAGGPAQRIARAIRWLRDHFAEPLRVEVLAREVRMSLSALHHHFKGVTAMSPLQYQKRLRLQEARRLMLGEGLDASAAAFRVGYESPSQFSREYRRQFGAPPRRDVATIQAEPVPV